MKEQKFTSANTSINKNRLPALYNKITLCGNVLDYGCGKYTDHIRARVMSEPLTESIRFYDPFNQPDTINHDAWNYGHIHGYDRIVCCNVLNVIDDADMIHTILENMFSMIRNNLTTIYIQIYEGDKSGIGRVTKNDCFQRNEPTSQYMNYLLYMVNDYSFDVKVTGNIIIISNIEKQEG